MVICRKYGRELAGLDAPPLPGKRGEEIFNTISKRAWGEWQALQTMLINEKHLRLIEPSARKYLTEQMQRFFDNEPTDVAEHYTPTPPGD
jgi:Fe-S cluster biosynthesis and repair protein YggX